MTADQRREQAKKLSLEKGLTQAAIAAKIGVSQRTVERWASEDGWGARRKAETQKVIFMDEAKSKPASAPAPTQSDRPRPQRRGRGEIDELEIIEGAIASLDGILNGLNSFDDDRPVDYRSVGGIAGALVKLLEYRRKIQPPTAAELAELVLASGLSPAEFTRELKDRWLQRA